MPKISVIIPAYNCAQYISETVESVLAQTYQDYEIIIVDDGSTDNTKDVLSKYVEAYPNKVIYIYQQNAGEGGARNRGLKESVRDYVAFLDSDDIWLPTKLEKQMALVDSLKGEDIVVFGDQYQFNDSGAILLKSMFKILKPYNGFVYEKLLYENFLTTNMILTKRDFFNKVGYFKEGMKYCADFEMWLRLAKHYKFYYVEDLVAGYRIHSAQVSGNIHKMREYHLMVVNEALNNLKANAILTNNVLSNQHYKYGYMFWDKNYYADARLDFRISLRHLFKLKTFLYMLATYLPPFFIENIRTVKKVISKYF